MGGMKRRRWCWAPLLLIGCVWTEVEVTDSPGAKVEVQPKLLSDELGASVQAGDYSQSDAETGTMSQDEAGTTKLMKPEGKK